MSKTSILIITTLLSSMLSSSAYASRILVTEVFGIMDRVDSGFNNLFQVGDPFSGRFTIDLDAEYNELQSEFFNSTEGLAVYAGGGTGLLNIESSTSAQPYSISNVAMKHYVYNNYPFASGVVDSFGASENSAFHGNPLAEGSISFSIDDPSAAMLSDYSLPTTTPNFTYGDIRLEYEADSKVASGSIDRVSISTIQVAAVPNGSPVWLLVVTGLFILFSISFAKRRKVEFRINGNHLPCSHSILVN